MLKRAFIFILLIIQIGSIVSTIVLLGDGLSSSTFSFPLLGQFAFDESAKILYVCASEVPSSQATSYGVSALPNGYSVFVPMLTPQAIVNGMAIANPLLNTGFNLISLGTVKNKHITKSVPVVVPTNNVNTAYAIMNFAAITGEKTQILTTVLPDANGSDDSRIVTLSPVQSGFIGAVCAANTLFGSQSSAGILMGKSFTESNSITNGPTLLTLQDSFIIPYNNTLPALALNNNPVTLIPDDVSLAYDKTLNLLYVGVGIESSQGGRAVTIYDQEITPESACINLPIGAPDAIIASTASPVAVYDLTTTITSTNLSYLIVLGGPQATTPSLNTPQNTVYAMPLVNNKADGVLGHLANVRSIPAYVFNTFYPYVYVASVFAAPATSPGDLYSSQSPQAQVGGGPLKLSAQDVYQINTIFASQDAVFAQAQYIGSRIGADGLFYSQAIFDEFNRVAGWTGWQRKELVGSFNATMYDVASGNYFDISTQVPGSVVKTSWGLDNFFSHIGQTPLAQTPLARGGIQNVVDIPAKNPATGRDSAQSGPSFMMQLGNSSIVIQQTSAHNNAIPVTSGPSFISTTGDSLEGFQSPVTTIAFFGGILAQADALITGGLAYIQDVLNQDLVDAWFVAGGAGGLYILAHEDGSGVGPHGIQDGFAGCQPTLAWRQLGNYHSVKKICVDSGFLYVLTNTNFDRIALNASNIALGAQCQATTLAQPGNFTNLAYASFADTLVSGKMALLATSAGLFRIGNTSDVSIAQTAQDCMWQQLPLPEGPISALYLYPVTRTGLPQDISRGNGSNDNLPTANIYVLAASFANHQGNLYRFVCYDTVFHQVTDKSCIMIPSFFVAKRPSYFFDTKSANTSIATDGASWYANVVGATETTYRGITELLPAPLNAGVPSLIKSAHNSIMAPLNSVLSPTTFISGQGIWAEGTINGLYSFR